MVAFSHWFKSKREIGLERRLQATVRAAKRAILKARYDAAQTNAENRRHWEMADGLSARSANSFGVRMTLRNRARYEACSNSYCAGMLLTIANDMVGTGPRLNVKLRGDRETSRLIEREFFAWCRYVKLAQKLRTMRITRARDGEVFALLTTNRRLPTPVKLDFKLLEADQVTTPALDTGNPRAIDGIRYDEDGNPSEYDILPFHPGDDVALPNWQPKVHPAEQVIHWFRADRPGQLRGVPEITPALPLYAQLRRYTLAVIAAAETAADFAGVLKAPARPAGGDDGDEDFEPPPDQLTEIEVSRRMLLTTPDGYELQQLKAEQPVTNYGMFKQEILNEIARCQNMPYNVAAGNSAGYNYSSGRLDHQIYFRSIGIDQSDCETEVLDRLFAAWLQEARLIRNYLPPDVPAFYLLPHGWAWDPAEDLDPLKTAQARLINLAAGITNHQREYAALGLDWEVEQENQAESLGITLPQYHKLLRNKLLGSIAGVKLAEQDNVTARLRRRVRRLQAALTGRLGA